MNIAVVNIKNSNFYIIKKVCEIWEWKFSRQKIEATSQNTERVCCEYGKKVTHTQKENWFSLYGDGQRAGLTSAHFSFPWNLKTVTSYCFWPQKMVGQQNGCVLSIFNLDMYHLWQDFSFRVSISINIFPLLRRPFFFFFF